MRTLGEYILYIHNNIYIIYIYIAGCRLLFGGGRATNPAFYGARTRPRARTDRDDNRHRLHPPALLQRYRQHTHTQCAGVVDVGRDRAVV